MCGILGGTDPGWDYAKALECLRHRGPDAQHLRQVRRLNLGFARLAVIDPRAVADQPMVSQDGSVWLVFNGEIYGFQALRRELERDHHFRTFSDSEVLLNAYLQWGDGFLEHLDGMFAAAIYDTRVERLVLFRDRPGIKPLYYYWNGREFGFASELKGIEALIGRENLVVDPTAIYDFLTYRYVPYPKTLFKDVYQLPPASRLVFDLRRRELASLDKYWQVPMGIHGSGTDVDEACRELRRAIEISVAEQMVADVPLGFFLSGGMDSSAVVAAASQGENELRTFTIGFDVSEHTETRFARQVAELFGTVHHEENLSREATTELFDQMKTWYDEPFADTSAIPTYLVSRCARQKVTVALSGDGGDEIFGGYRWYTLYRTFRRLGFGRTGDLSRWVEKARDVFPHGPLHRVLNLASLVGSDELSLYVQLMGGMTRGEKRRHAVHLGIDPDYDDLWFFRQFWRPDLPLLTRLQYLDFHTFLPGDILTKVDRASMANSLEVRVPLLSRRLVELAFSLPEDLRFHGGRLKGLFKRSYRGILPSTIIEREKRGFSVPLQYQPAAGRRRFQERILEEHYGIQP